jgi:thiol-disulfide isomerase/thioredoxin
MRYGLLAFLILAAIPTSLCTEVAVDVALSRVVLHDADPFFGSKALSFIKPTAPPLTLPEHWTEIDRATLVDNPRLNPVTLLRFKDERGALGYAVAADGGTTYDATSVLRFHAFENRRVADLTIPVRPRNNAQQAPREVACQILLSNDRVIARLSECREGTIRIGEHSYPIRIYAPSLSNPYYSLSPEVACLIDTDKDGTYSWKWHLADSGRAVVPSERVSLIDPFRLDGKSLKAIELDSEGDRLTCESYYGDTSAVVGFKAPDVAFTDLAGKTHRLSDLHGKVVLMTFWSTTCPYCEEIRPALNALVGRCNPARFQAIAAAGDRDTTDIATFLRTSPYDGITLSYEPSLWRTYDRRGTTPVFVLIDQEGTIALAGSGASLMAVVERMTADLLQ